MNATNAPAKSLWYKAWIAARFVVFGIGGFWLLMFCWIALVEALTPDGERFMNPFLALPLALAGALMTLFGGGVWGRWAYLWVFLSTPLLVTGLLLLPRRYTDGVFDKGSVILVFTMPLVISYLLVRLYYRQRTARSQDIARP